MVRLVQQSALDLPCRADAVSSARAFVRAKFAKEMGDGPRLASDVLDNVELVTSELVSNAIRFATRRVRVEASLHRDHVQVSVFDDSPQSVKVRSAEDLDESGRGLAIVAALSAEWGVLRLHQEGKQVWARVPLGYGAAGDRRTT